MQSLNSAKIVVGVHCGKLRTKGMYVQSIMDPAEATFYDQYDAAAYWCSATQTSDPQTDWNKRSSNSSRLSTYGCLAFTRLMYKLRRWFLNG